MSFLDHDFTSLPPRRFLAADGLHPSFSGVALLAQNLKGRLHQGYSSTPPGWSSEIPAATTNPPQETPTTASTVPQSHSTGNSPPSPAAPVQIPGASLPDSPAGNSGLDVSEYPTPAESMVPRKQRPAPRPSPYTGQNYNLRRTAKRDSHTKED